ncbi:hypothetical protein M8818_000126 [Zalaria obscura]|uniref:Uncharacterized protein n=1 Tax=Zalaria obscura TaxID=2024903 RepID=A0ACC3SP92_9PEZI
MARSNSGTRVIIRRGYYWPDQQLNFWIIVMLATAGTILGIFADFITVQNQLKVGIPWIFPYGVTVGSLTVIFIILMLILISQKRLEPGVVRLGSFILIVLFITGLIETAIQLFGPAGDVNGNCQRYVTNQPSTGVSIDTLAWLEQNGICSSWMAAFAFWIVGTVFLIWLFIMASMVNRNRDPDDY